ncbi:MAG: alkylation response protein AidB-like acyl-CoA dehydrogenase [Candidatus Azotimanducaceae bacterium]|jgi:alkylation response protein AidB-like acyl-CoA dehydrogenase
MDLSYTDEQNLLRDSLQRFISSSYDINHRNKLTSTEEGFSRENWQQYADLGWLAMSFAEEDGGIGGTPVDTQVMMEEFGKGLIVEPFLASIVMAGTALSEAGSAAQKEALIPGLIDGSLIATVAIAEPDTHQEFERINMTATLKDGEYILSGQKAVVLSAQSANQIIVAARTSGQDADHDGISFFIVAADSKGLSRKDFPTVDGLRASDLTFDSVKVPADSLLGEEGKGYPLLTKILNRAILALSAEAVGAMEVLYKDTIAYTKQREQFDHALSDFQVLKHRMTEMFVEYSLAKSLTLKATMLESQGSEETQRTIHALKYLIGKTSRFVAQNAVQLHGGMGMTEELRVAHYFKRLTVIDAMFGNTDYHLERFVG